MSIIIPAVFVLSTFFLTAWAMFSALVDATNDQTESLRVANELYEERFRTHVKITGTSTSGDGYAMTVLNDSKSVAFGDFAQIDLFAHYTDSTGGTRVQRLTHSTDWSVSKISGDAANPGFWDPGETATISFSVTPNLQACTQGTALIAVPGGVADATYFGSSPLCLFWHNDPTPPVGNTVSHTELSMDGTEPTGETLFNYDTDRDSVTGLLILKGGNSATESDLTKHQVWRTASLAASLLISGAVTIDFWSGLVDFKLSSTGRVTIFLRDRDTAGDYTEIGNGQIFDNNWQGGTGDFVKKTMTISGLDYTVPTGHQLEAKLMVHPGSSDNMWFAYDTSVHTSVLFLP